jgi:hypothetical protein
MQCSAIQARAKGPILREKMGGACRPYWLGLFAASTVTGVSR